MEREAPRTKNISYVLGASALAGACAAAGVAWKASQHDPRYVGLAFSAALGLAVALRLGVYLVGLILSDEVKWDRFPLELWLPVKGRWLRLLTLGPLALLYVGACWAIVTVLVGWFLMLASGLFGG